MSWLHEPENVWHHRDVAPYTPFPSWWREFVFRVLRPNELAAYLAICCYVSREGVAYADIDRLTNDLGLKGPKRVRAAVETLQKYRFLIVGEQPMGKKGQLRPVFQRPLIHDTLIALIDARLIDWRLRHVGYDPKHDPSVPKLAYERLFTRKSEDRDLFNQWLDVSRSDASDEQKTSKLRRLLELRKDELRSNKIRIKRAAIRHEQRSVEVEFSQLERLCYKLHDEIGSARQHLPDQDFEKNEKMLIGIQSKISEASKRFGEARHERSVTVARSAAMTFADACNVRPILRIAKSPELKSRLVEVRSACVDFIDLLKLEGECERLERWLSPRII